MENASQPSLSPSILDYDVFDLAGRAFDAYPEPQGLADFGPYQIRRRIDKGGMGEVWLAYDYIACREVAIKIPRYLSDPDLRKRFATEVTHQAKLEHPFIARLYDHGICPDGTPYFAMEFVDGKPLDEYCRAGNLPLKERVRLLRAVCEAVQYAHALLVVHRDLKPSNILVKDGGTPKLLDFGVAARLAAADEPARQTQTEAAFTRAFAAPEQFRREPVGVYTDVYALGVILYQLLTGRLPYDLDDCTPGQAELMVTGEGEPAKPSAIAGKTGKADWNDLDVLCLTAMKKDVPRRYSSVVQFAQDLDHYLKGEPLQARPDSLSYRAGKFVRRNRKAVVASALAFAAAAGLILFFTLRLANARDQANRETAIATAMNRFLSNDLLAQSDPYNSGQAEEPFVDVVDRASARIDAQFQAQPLVAARLHQTIARAFDNRSEFPQARREYSRATVLFKQAGSPKAIVANLQRAAMEARSFVAGALPLAKSLVGDSQKSIAGMTNPGDEITVWLLAAQATIAITESDAHLAEERFTAALRKAQTVPSFDQAAQMRLQRALASTYIHLGQGVKAEQLLHEVIAVFAKTDGPESPACLRARVNLAQAFLAQHRYRAAVQEANRIYPLVVAKFGENHEVTMALLGARAAAEGSAGMFGDAIRDDLTVYHYGLRKHGPGSMFSIAPLSDAALSQCLSHRYAEGAANARQAFNESNRAFGSKSGLTGGTAFSLAFCLMGLNKLDEASQLLRSIDVQAATYQSGDSRVAGAIAMTQGEIAVRRGDYLLAKRYADRVGTMFDTPDAAVGDRQEIADLRKALAAHLGGK